ncbi:caspase family protein [Granulosicoccus antarcticus]|uniref:caspase family protein n=1 Tax=Granulosicoccus antarcticus TaxID=437505 RepID=UPI00146FC2A1|nr:caspase family protein [Granulosicoccus antarcticus]
MLIVDCLLPGQLRRLGRSITYLTPRRPVKVPTSECEIRGGEYVAYDRANFSTSLKIWLPKAESGDPEAQTYVGEIFEKGLGLQADPVVAASWYQKAADQRFSRAQVNLGYLYESGIGVPQDLVKAMNYYREAAGFDEGSLEYTTALQVANRKQQTLDLVSREQDIERLNQTVAQLEIKNTELRNRQVELRTQQNNINALADETAQQRKRVLELGVSTTSSTSINQSSEKLVTALEQLDTLNLQLSTTESEKAELLGNLREQQASTDSLRQKFNASNKELNAANENLLAQKQKISKLESASLSGGDSSAQMLQLQSRLTNAQQAFEKEASKTDNLQRTLAQKSTLLQNQIANAESRELSLKGELSRLSGNVADTQLSAAQLKNELTAQINTRQSEVEQLKRQLNNAVRELSVTQAGLENTQGRLGTPSPELARANTVLQQQNTEFTQQIAAAIQLEESLKTELDRLGSSLADEQIDKARLQRQITAQLQEQTQQAQQLQSQLQRSNSQLEQARIQIEQGGKSNTSQPAQFAQLQQQLAQQQSTLALQIEGTERQQKQLLSDLELMRVRAVDSEAQNKLLKGEIAQQEMLIASLSTRYEESVSALSAKDSNLGTQQTQIAQLQEELQRVRESSINSTLLARADNKDLQETLNTERETFAALQQEVENLRGKQTGESRTLENQLAAADQTEALLKRQLESSSDVAESLQQQLMAQQQQYQAQLKEAENEVVAVKGELNRAQDERIDAQLKLASLESDLVQQQQMISTQESEINKLQSEVTKAQAQADKPAIEQVPQIVNAGPIIEIIEPDITITRGGPAMKILSNAAKSFDVIGKISPSNNILSFKIDSTSVDLNDNGVFKYPADVSSPSLRMVAIDDAGERTDLELQLSQMRSANTTAEQPSSDISGIEFGNFHALIIGNNRFENLQNLKTAENDAIAVEALLREKYGFKTKLLLNATRYDMLSALNSMRENLTSEDNLLIYYAGHGELANETGYWLPVDAEPDSDVNWIPNSTITKYVETINAKHIIVIADSCYSGTLSRTSLSRLGKGLTTQQKHNWYETIASAKVRTVFTSGGLKPVLDSVGGSSQHSIFSAAFLNELETSDEPVVSTYKLFLRVQERVKAEATRLGLEQNPQYSPMQFAGHESGEFLFISDQDNVTSKLEIPTYLVVKDASRVAALR